MKTGSNWKKMEGKILLSEKTSMEMRAAWKKNIYLEILNSNDSKFLFIVNTTWQMTRWRRFKNSSNFTSWTTFTHQNAPFWKTTPFRNWKQCTAVISASHEIVMQSQSQRYFVGLINKFRTWKLFTITFQACITFYTQTPWIIFLLIVWWIYTLRFT